MSNEKAKQETVSVEQLRHSGYSFESGAGPIEERVYHNLPTTPEGRRRLLGQALVEITSLDEDQREGLAKLVGWVEREEIRRLRNGGLGLPKLLPVDFEPGAEFCSPTLLLVQDVNHELNLARQRGEAMLASHPVALAR